MKRIFKKVLVCFMAAVALSACISEPPPPKVIPPRPDRETISRFVMSARAAIKQGQKAQTFRLTWQHTSKDDSVGFSSPLGIAVAELQRDEQGARWLAADGEKYEAHSADALMARVTREPVPLDSLALWVLGRVSPMAQNVKKDELGRLVRAEDQDWIVEIGAYENDKPNALPSLVTVSHGVLQFRMSIEDWAL